MVQETNCALLLAAGSGSRMMGKIDDKILFELNRKAVFRYSSEAFSKTKAISQICIVYRDDTQRRALLALTENIENVEILWAQGGSERQESVLNGLETLPENTAYTLIHDCARPLVSTDSIHLVIEEVRRNGAACLAHPVIDTIKRVPSATATSQIKLEDLDRKLLWAMETPQAFQHAEILRAYRQIQAQGISITDDAGAAAHIGMEITLVPNQAPNPKITTVADLDYVEWLLSK